MTTKTSYTPNLDPKSMREYRRSIMTYIDSITSAPGMFAITREAYVAQLSLLVDLLGLNGNALYQQAFGVRSLTNSDVAVVLDEDFAAKTNALLALQIKELIDA